MSAADRQLVAPLLHIFPSCGRSSLAPVFPEAKLPTPGLCWFEQQVQGMVQGLGPQIKDEA